MNIKIHGPNNSWYFPELSEQDTVLVREAMYSGDVFTLKRHGFNAFKSHEVEEFQFNPALIVTVEYTYDETPEDADPTKHW